MHDYATKPYTRQHRIIWRRILRALRGMMVRDRFDRTMPENWTWPR